MVNIGVGDEFPDFTLENHEGRRVSINDLARPSLLDRHLGFEERYPLIIVFYRGYFCPRDNAQMRGLVEFQRELDVNYGRLTSVSVEPWRVQAAFRAGLGATWPFLSDVHRDLTCRLGILDETEGEEAYPARPFTFVLDGAARVRRVYDGWFFVGRPTLDELRLDLREIMAESSRYPYEAYTADDVRRIRVPQQEWSDPTTPGADGLPVAEGRVLWFDDRSGNGVIEREASDDEVFFNFTAIPGRGYRRIRAGTPVVFEVVQNRAGPTARNIQAKPPPLTPH